jgi:hypothetical protein
MAKNQKKQTVLSMGGMVPRRQRSGTPVHPDSVKAAEPLPPQLKTVKPASKNKNKTGVFRRIISLKWKVFYILVPAFITALYVFDIHKFPPLSPDNASQAYDMSSDIDSVAYLPIKAALLALHKLNLGNQYNMRYLSVLVMLLGVFCFYKFIASWISSRMAMFSTLLFACSTWALLQTRQDSVTTMQLALIPAILYLGTLIIRSDSWALKLICSILLAQFIFVPGAIWFFIFFAVIGVYLNDKTTLKTLLLPMAAFLITLAAYGALVFHWSITSYHQIVRLAGPELGVLPTLSTIKANLTDLPGQLFYSGLNDPTWLKSTPIVDWVSAIFLLAGFIYLFRTKLHPIRKKVIISFFVLALVLVLLNSITYVSVLLPLIYLCIGLGMTYLADQWMIIFPNNPLARSLGLVMIGVIVFSVCFFHLERYFVGWPKTDEYHQIYKS